VIDRADSGPREQTVGRAVPKDCVGEREGCGVMERELHIVEQRVREDLVVERVPGVFGNGVGVVLQAGRWDHAGGNQASAGQVHAGVLELVR
jgi:hypothetical protein